MAGPTRTPPNRPQQDPAGPAPRGLWRLTGRIALAGALASLGACSMLPSIRGADSFLGLITPYRMDIVQGNVVTREQAERVRPGMTRAQVRDVLGSPMLTDLFHADRWDYTFTIRRQGTEPQKRTVTVWFKEDRLERIEAPALPSEREFVAAISRGSPRGTVPTLELTPEQMRALPAPAARPPEPAPAPQGPVREYPPLEPT